MAREEGPLIHQRKAVGFPVSRWRTCEVGVRVSIAKMALGQGLGAYSSEDDLSLSKGLIFLMLSYLSVEILPLLATLCQKPKP